MGAAGSLYSVVLTEKFMNIKHLVLCCALAVSATAFAKDSAAAFYERALQFQQQKQLKQAEIELKNSLQQDSEFLPARLLLGQVLLQDGQWAGAEKELQLALAGGAALEPLLYQLGRAMLAQQKADETRLLLAGYPQLQQQSEYLLLQAGYLKASFQYDQAHTVYQQLLKQSLTEPLASEAWYEMADLQFRQQDYPASLQSVEHVSSHSDFAARASYLRARLFITQQQPAKAMQIYTQLLEKDPDDAIALIGQAQLLLQQGQTKDALALVTRFRDQNPNNPYGQLLHASILGQLGDDRSQSRMLKQIQQQLTTLSTEQRESEEVLMISALLDFSDGRFEQTISKLSRYQKLYPANVQASQLLAQSYLQLADYRGAEKHIQQAIQLNPNDPALQLIAAAIARAQRDVNAEVQLLTTARAQFPQHQEVKKAYLQALLRAGQSSKARELLHSQDNATELSDQLLLGYLLLENQQLNEAQVSANALLKSNPDKVEVFQFAGDVAAKSADAALAAQFYQQVLHLDPHYKPTLLSLASLALQQQDWSQASHYYQQILAQTPDDSLVLQLMADAAIRSQQPAQAIAYLEKLASDDPKLASARLALLELYVQTAQQDKATQLAAVLTEELDIRPELYFAKARIALLKQDQKAVMHNTDILYGLWYDAPKQLVSLATLQLDNQDVMGLRKTLSRLGQFNEQQAQVTMLQARLALAQQQPKQGLALLNQLEKQQGRNAAIDELKAHLLLADGQLALAAPLFESLYRQSGAIEHLLPLLRSKQSDPQYVNTQLRAWLQKHPSDLSATLLLAEQLQRAGLPDAAIEVYQQSTLLQSQPVLLNNLAALLLPDQAAEAVVHAKKAHELMPDQPDISDTYGYSLVLTGEPAAGLGVLRNAEIRRPESALLQLHIADALQRLQRADEAKTILQRLHLDKLNEEEKRLFQQLSQQ